MTSPSGPPPPLPPVPPALQASLSSLASPSSPGSAPGRPAAASPTPPAPPSSIPAKLSNRYVRRLTAEPGKACFVCSRPSTCVLVSTTAGAEDFFYVCPSHLADRHFATLILNSQSASGAAPDSTSRLPEKVSKDEIEKVKKEYEERQRAKKEAEAQRQNERAASSPEGDKKDGDEKVKGKDGQQGWLSYLTSALTESSSSSESPSTASKQTPSPSSGQASPKPQGHEYYSLHRSFYQMRLDAHNQKVAVRRARELGFPSVPRG